MSLETEKLQQILSVVSKIPKLKSLWLFDVVGTTSTALNILVLPGSWLRATAKWFKLLQEIAKVYLLRICFCKILCFYSLSSWTSYICI